MAGVKRRKHGGGRLLAGWAGRWWARKDQQLTSRWQRSFSSQPSLPTAMAALTKPMGGATALLLSSLPAQMSRNAQGAHP